MTIYVCLYLSLFQLTGNENVAVQMNPQSQVIISTGAGQEQLAGATLHLPDGTLNQVIQEQIINGHDLGEQIIGEHTMVGIPLQSTISQEAVMDGESIKHEMAEHHIANTTIVEDAVGNDDDNENHTIIEDGMEEDAVSEHVITKHDAQGEKNAAAGISAQLYLY